MKLFKKVSAAILAGIMALSMVACATTPVIDPTEPDTPVTPANAETEVLKYINTYRNSTYGIVDAEQVASDATMKAQAQAIADMLAADPNTNIVNRAVWTNNGHAIVETNKLTSKLQVAGISTDLPENVYVITAAGDVNEIEPFEQTVVTANRYNGLEESITLTGYDFDVADDLIYSVTQNAKQELAKAGYRMGQSVQNIGVGSATVRGQQCVIIVSNAALDLTTPVNIQLVRG